MQHTALTAPGGSDSTIIGKCLIKGRQGLLIAFLLPEHQAFIVPGLRHVWIEAESHIKGMKSLVGATKGTENGSFAVP